MKHAHMRKADLPFTWPEPPLHVILHQPEIPPNTGNIARLCAATNTRLHLIEPLGFRIDDAKLRRAGLDYWDDIQIRLHPNLDACLTAIKPNRLFLFSTAGNKSYHTARYAPGDALLFGCETSGLPQSILDAFPGQVYGIPMRTDHVRSLNLSSAVAIVLYEALRQQQSGVL